MTYTALQIGNELIRCGNAKSQPLTNLQIQKLIYFAHGWHLVLAGSPLIEESFEAWRYGPVVPELYHVFKTYGSSAIPVDHLFCHATPQVMDTSIVALLDRILEVYGKFTPGQLVEISHDPEGPWVRVYHDSSPTQRPIIPNSEIKSYFLRLAKGKQA